MRITLLILSILLASCSEMSMPTFKSLTPHKIEVQQGNLITPEMREKVKVGMPRNQVRAILGTPLINDPFHASRWDYVYYLKQDGDLTGEQRLTLYFEEDRLTRIDDSGMPKMPAEKK